MFSGIIEHLGEVAKLEAVEQGRRISIESPLFAQSPPGIGDSIAVSGVCLTVISLSGSRADFDVASETCRCTTLGQLAEGSKVNLEQSLRVGDRLHGHFVLGHVDGVGEVKSFEQEGETWKLVVSFPPELRKYFAKKGSAAINGVSMTLGEVTSEALSVYIIPHTFEATTFHLLKPTSKVNLEIDVLARYVLEAA